MARDLLAEVQRDMAFMGWQGPCHTGFTHKEDANGKVIARAHDATWLADYEESEARCGRQIAREAAEDEATKRGKPNVPMRS